MEANELSTFLDGACEAARRGAAILEDWRSRFQVREKGRFDLVTEADLSSQKAIQSYLLERFPDHDFLGEEDEGPRSQPSASAPPTWVVDPLDGTTNYVHDVPMYCVSIGLWAGEEMVVGVVFDPRQDEMFAAAKGQGATLNGEKIQTSAISSLGEAILATGFPPDMRGQERALDWFRFFSTRAQSLRRTGSTALNLAYVACGRFDGYWAFDNFPWDVSGGMVLVSEAGGICTNEDGTPFDPFTPDGVIANLELHPLMMQAMKDGPT